MASKNTTIDIKKRMMNWTAMAGAFVISFYNVYLLISMLLLVCIVLSYKYGSIGCIYSLLFIQLRSVLNPAIAINMGQASIIKWIAIFYLSLYILFFCKNNIYFSRVCKVFIPFSIYLFIAQFFVSGYPIVSVFKIVSWVIPFLAVLKGVLSNKMHNLINNAIIALGILVFGSYLTIPFPAGYVVNGHALQGLFNHPNLFGIMVTLFLAGCLYIWNKKFSISTITIVIGSMALVLLSESRTSLISCGCLVVCYIFFSELNKKVKYGLIFIIFIAICVLLFTENSIREAVLNFIYKGGDGFSDIFNSRKVQIENSLKRFMINPLFGNGFNVPYNPIGQSFIFSFSLITENGNLFLALLGDVGLVGLMYFIYAYFKLFKFGNKKAIILFVAPFLVSMGEMSFFSTNNFAILLYMFFAVYLVGGLSTNENCFCFQLLQSPSGTVIGSFL